MITWSAACVLGGLVVGFYSILFTRLLLGIAETPFFIVATKIIQQNFANSQRGIISSIVSLGPRLANILAPLVLVALMILINWRGMFILLGAIGLIAAVLWQHLQKKGLFKEAKSVNKTQQISIKKVLKNKNVIFLCIGNLCSSYAYWLFLTWLPYYFINLSSEFKLL